MLASYGLKLALDTVNQKLSQLTHREGSLWRETAKEHGLLEDAREMLLNTVREVYAQP